MPLVMWELKLLILKYNGMLVTLMLIQFSSHTGSTGYVTGLTDTGTGTQIDANEESIITTVGYTLDESRMSVDQHL